MQRVSLAGGWHDATGNSKGAGSQGHDSPTDCQVNWSNAVIDMAHRRGDNDRPEVLGDGFIKATTWRQGMSREVMQMALDMLNEIADDVYCDQKLEGVITALRQALETEREWVGLTADEIWKCNKASGSSVEFHICYEHQNLLDFAEAIEDKLREKNKW